jgi:uncharacterized protein YjbJ (UPF0337 family)
MNQQMQRTVRGLLGKAIGRAKEAIGQTTDDGTLAREGRLQQAQARTEREATEVGSRAQERERDAELRDREVKVGAVRDELRNEVAADQREGRILAERRADEARAQTGEDRSNSAATAEEAAEHAQANRAEREAEQARQLAEADAARLEREAAETDRSADKLDPDKEQR